MPVQKAPTPVAQSYVYSEPAVGVYMGERLFEAFRGKLRPEDCLQG